MLRLRLTDSQRQKGKQSSSNGMQVPDIPRAETKMEILISRQGGDM